MKAPVVLVTAALTVAILLAASFLIATGTRGEDSLWPVAVTPAAKYRRAVIACDKRKAFAQREPPGEACEKSTVTARMDGLLRLRSQ